MYKTGIFTTQQKGRTFIYTLFDQDGNKLAQRISPRQYVAAIFVDYQYEILKDGAGYNSETAINNPGLKKGLIKQSIPEANYFGRPSLIKEKCHNQFYHAIATGDYQHFNNEGRKITQVRAYICKPIPHHADIDPRHVEMSAGLILKLAEAKINTLSPSEIERAFEEVASPEYCYNATIKLADAKIITFEKVKRKEYILALEALPNFETVETVIINKYRIQWNPLFSQYITSHAEIGAGLGAYNADQLNGSMKGYYSFTFEIAGEFPLEEVKALLPTGTKQNFYSVNADIAYKEINIHESYLTKSEKATTIVPTQAAAILAATAVPGFKIYFECFFTHTRTIIDLTKDRWNCAEQLADAYCKKDNKRKTDKIIESFATGSNLYHTVRNLLEHMRTDNFIEVLSKFKALYPVAHPDWQSALKCGLIYTAQRREGNYYNTPYIYQNNFTAILLQNSDMNTVAPIVNEILEDESIVPDEIPAVINTTAQTEKLPY